MRSPDVRSFFSELKRRNVYRVAIAYLIFAGGIIQLTSAIFPAWELPNWTLRLVIVLLFAGFPIALMLGWTFDLTATGVERTPDAPKSGRSSRWQQWTLVLLGTILAAAILTTYWLWAPVKPAPNPSVGLTNETLAEKSIAVLPFDNLSDDKQNAYFADGVQVEILTDLARVADLKVISRTSAMQYRSGAPRNLREIGKALGVSHLLEGSVQRAGGTVRVHAQLIDARSDTQLWAQTYDQPLADVFTIQSEVAKAIADQLRAKLSPSEKAAIERPPTSDFTAYDVYLRAQTLYSDTTGNFPAREKLPKAAELLEQAVRRDPDFLAAWCLLSRIHGDMYFEGYDHTPERLASAKTAAETALHLQPQAGEAHLSLAQYFYHGFRDYERAREELTVAQRTLPNNPEIFEYMSYIDRRDGRWDQAAREMERSLVHDPRNFLSLQQMAITYSWQARYAEQAQILDRALTIVPGDPLTRITRAGVAIDWQADVKPFQRTLATLIAEDTHVASTIDDPFWALCERTPAAAARMLQHYPNDGEVITGVNVPRAYWEGAIARWQGQAEKAQAAFVRARSELETILAREPEFPEALSFLGIVDAGLGRKDDAVREGRRACELLPTSKDAIAGMGLEVNLAQIYVWTGEKNLAINQIAAIERKPNGLTYGLLKLHPYWDPLRAEPRFEQIVQSLAPKKTTSR